MQFNDFIKNKAVTETSDDEHMSNTRLGTYDRNLDRVLRMAQASKNQELEDTIKARMKKIHYTDPRAKKAAEQEKETVDRHKHYSSLIHRIELGLQDLVGTEDVHEPPGICDAVAAAGLDPDKLLDLYGDEIHDAWTAIMGKPFNEYAADMFSDHSADK